jgi:hypothetical protein
VESRSIIYLSSMGMPIYTIDIDIYFQLNIKSIIATIQSISLMHNILAHVLLWYFIIVYILYNNLKLTL